MHAISRPFLVVIAVLSLFLFTEKASAQRGELDYAIGLRLGPGTGLSVQKFKTDRKVIEGILYTRYRGFNLCGLMQFHERLTRSVKGLKYYYGGGAHLGRYSYYSGHPVWTNEANKGSEIVVGVDAVLGLEFYLPDLPVQISVDWKPEYNLIGWSGFSPDNGAISVRWRF